MFVALLIIIVNLGWWGYYAKTEKSLEKQLARRLGSIAQLGAESVTPEILSALQNGEPWADGEIYFVLQAVKAADSLSEVFILRPDRRYLATTSGYIDRDSVYFLAPLHAALLDSSFAMGSTRGLDLGPTPVAVTSSYKIGDLFLKSAFAPLYDTTGLTVAVLGVEADVDYTDDLLELKNSLYLSSGLSLGVGLLLGMIFFLFQRRVAASEKSVMLSQSQANLGRMVAVVSHEIKNPLMIIRASAESLKKKSGQAEADFILEEIDRLNRIVTGYLDFASGKMNLASEKIDLVPLIDDMITQFGPRLARENIVLKSESRNTPLIVIADPAALRQVLINLILNAAEAVKGKERAVVDLAVKTEDRVCKITITDDGPGIDNKTMKAIFEPFYTTKTTGSGLGLYLSRRLVEQMHGKIEGSSHPGEKTVFTVTLPKA